MNNFLRIFVSFLLLSFSSLSYSWTTLNNNGCHSVALMVHTISDWKINGLPQDQAYKKFKEVFLQDEFISAYPDVAYYLHQTLGFIYSTDLPSESHSRNTLELCWAVKGNVRELIGKRV